MSEVGGSARDATSAGDRGDTQREDNEDAHRHASPGTGSPGTGSADEMARHAPAPADDVATSAAHTPSESTLRARIVSALSFLADDAAEDDTSVHSWSTPPPDAYASDLSSGSSGASGTARHVARSVGRWEDDHDVRACRKCGRTFTFFVRKHHCRRCGKCVLRMDHHCPWVGRCIGAQNYRFYINTVFWAAVFTTYTLVSIAVLFARGVRSQSPGGWARSIHDWDVDGWLISVLVMSFFFFLFTCSLLVIHVQLSMHNLTSVEQRAINTERSIEGALLRRYYSDNGEGTTLGHGPLGVWRRLRARRELLRKWNEHWGAFSTKGNPWWIGSRAELAYAADSPQAYQRAANLEKTLGLEPSESVAHIVPATARTLWSTSPLLNMELSIGKPWTWLLPLGRPDRTYGVHFALNPRYNDRGEWLPRPQWPDVAS